LSHHPVIPAARWWRGGALAVGLVATLLGLLVPAPAVASATPPNFTTKGLWIVDRQGRDVVLRGFDLTGAEDTPTADPLPYGPADFAGIRASGATVVRLPIAWAMIEPRPGYFDSAALARVRQIVGWATEAGLKVVLDMHQYLWTACFGGNGVPQWAVPNCPASVPSNVVEQLLYTLAAENVFWHSPALQADFIQTWVKVAQAVGDPSLLLGYDLLNEPGPGLIPNEVFETDYLAPFYRAVGTALRAVNPGALLFVEPSILNGLVNGSSEFLAPIGLPNVVYEPHQYGAVSFNADTSVSVADLAGPSQFAPDLSLDVAVAQRIGAALWLGEWGAITPSASFQPDAYAADDLSEQDLFMMGSGYWSYDSAEAQPGLASLFDRAGPAAIAGQPESFSTGPGLLGLAWISDGGSTLISLPGACTPSVAVVAGEPVSTAASAGWLSVVVPAGVNEAIAVTCHS
jgi:hypothetical protein